MFRDAAVDRLVRKRDHHRHKEGSVVYREAADSRGLAVPARLKDSA